MYRIRQIEARKNSIRDSIAFAKPTHQDSHLRRPIEKTASSQKRFSSHPLHLISRHIQKQNTVEGIQRLYQGGKAAARNPSRGSNIHRHHSSKRTGVVFREGLHLPSASTSSKEVADGLHSGLR